MTDPIEVTLFFTLILPALFFGGCKIAQALVNRRYEKNSEKYHKLQIIKEGLAHRLQSELAPLQNRFTEITPAHLAQVAGTAADWSLRAIYEEDTDLILNPGIKGRPPAPRKQLIMINRWIINIFAAGLCLEALQLIPQLIHKYLLN